MFHQSWQHDGAVEGGLDDAAMLAAIDGGARVVAFELVLSFGTGYYKSTRLHLVPAGASPYGAAASTQLLTLLVGWWGLGILFMPTALWRNLRGGVDVTDAVRAHRLARLAASRAQVQAQAEVDVQLATVAATGTLEERQAAALVLLERRDVDGAWALVGKDVLDGPLRRDFKVVRKLLVTASDLRGQEARAGLLATIVVQDHPAEVKDYIGHLVRKSLRDANTPPGLIPRPPFLQTGRGLLTLLLGLVALAGVGGASLNEWLRLHRDLHVVNGTLDRVVVTVGGAVLRLPPGGHGVAVVEEGAVALAVERRGVTRPRTVDVQVRYLDRFRPAATIFNVEGAGVLLQEQRSWGTRAPELEADQVHVGDELVVLPGVEAFTTFPATKRLKRGESSVETHVVLRGGHPADLVYQLDGRSLQDALAYLELHAQLAPDDARTLDCYATLGLLTDPERATAFLEAGLLPTATSAWLMAWRRARRQAGDTGEAILARVQALEGPPGAARLAFEAMLAPDAMAAAALRARASAALAGAPEPLLAVAEAAAALRRGDLERARAELTRAGDGADQRDLALLLARAAGDEVAREALLVHERRLHRDRYSVDVAALLELRAALGGEKEVDAAIGPLLVELGEGDDTKGWRLRIRFARAMALGDVAALRTIGAEAGAPYPTFMAALLEGQPGPAAEAAAAVGADPSLADDLCLALALALVQGDEAAAARLRGILASAWTAYGPRGAPALEALAAGDAASAAAALDQLNLWPAACLSVRLAVAAGLPAGPERAALLAPVLPPRGPGYPCAVIRGLRESLTGPVRPGR